MEGLLLNGARQARPIPKRRMLKIRTELARTIAATKADHGQFVLNKWGRPYSYSGFDQTV